MRVRAGTKGLVFQKTAKTEDLVALFEITDAHTGKALSDDVDAAVILYREPEEGKRLTARTFFGPDGGSTSVDYRPYSDLRWIVAARGYEEQHGVIALPQEGDDMPVYRVELRQGFGRAIVARESRTGRRLADVVIRDQDGVRLVTTGNDGSANILRGEWPESLTFEREGYERLSWVARSHSGNFSHQVWLEPLGK